MIVNIFVLLILLLEIYLVLKYRKILQQRGTMILLTFTFFPLIAMPMQMYWDNTPKCIASTMSLIALFMLFQGELYRQLSQKNKELAEKE